MQDANGNSTLEDSAFDAIAEHSFESNACSPEIEDPDWRGIALNAPRVVKYAPGSQGPLDLAFARAIICGYAHFDYLTLDLRGAFLESILFVATHTETHEVYTGKLEIVANAIPDEPDDEEDSPEDLAGLSIGEYFNINIAAVVGLPEGSAEYKIHATLGEFRSNVVTMRIEAEE